MRDAFPIPVMELVLDGHRLASQLLQVFRPKRGISAEQHVGDGAEDAINFGVRKEPDEDVHS